MYTNRYYNIVLKNETIKATIRLYIYYYIFFIYYAPRALFKDIIPAAVCRYAFDDGRWTTRRAIETRTLHANTHCPCGIPFTSHQSPLRPADKQVHCRGVDPGWSACRLDRSVSCSGGGLRLEWLDHFVKSL